MYIDSLGLEAFLAIAEQGRFHKAARQRPSRRPPLRAGS